MSKILLYERPYSVTGTIKLTGLKEAPKYIYVKIELLERGNLRTWKRSNSNEMLLRKRRIVSLRFNYNLTLSKG